MWLKQPRNLEKVLYNPTLYTFVRDQFGSVSLQSGSFQNFKNAFFFLKCRNIVSISF